MRYDFTPILEKISKATKSENKNIINYVNTEKEYDFSEAWKKLLKGKVITSIKTKYSYGYSFNTDEKAFKLRVFIPVASLWQDAEYVLAKEMFERWYVTDIEKS